MSKVNQIVDAMMKRLKINIAYSEHGKDHPRGPYQGMTLYRDIAPFTIGTTTRGNLAVRAYDSYRGEWRLFLIPHIGRIQVQNELFNERSYPAYQGTDSMLNIQYTLSRMPREVGKQKIKKAKKITF